MGSNDTSAIQACWKRNMNILSGSDPLSKEDDILKLAKERF